MNINRNEIIDAFPSLNRIGSSSLRKLCLSFLIHVFERSPYRSIEQAYHFPEAQNIAKYILFDHINQVCELCEAICDNIQSIMKLKVDYDILLAGALLHDIDKYCIFDVYESGRVEKIEDKIHSVEGAKIARQLKIPEPICHIIESHSRLWAPVSPHSNEAILFRLVDEMVCELHYINSIGYSFEDLTKKVIEPGNYLSEDGLELTP